MCARSLSFISSLQFQQKIINVKRKKVILSMRNVYLPHKKETDTQEFLFSLHYQNKRTKIKMLRNNRQGEYLLHCQYCLHFQMKSFMHKPTISIGWNVGKIVYKDMLLFPFYTQIKNIIKVSIMGFSVSIIVFYNTLSTRNSIIQNLKVKVLFFFFFLICLFLRNLSSLLFKVRKRTTFHEYWMMKSI